MVFVTGWRGKGTRDTFFSFLASSIVLKGATPRTIASARPKGNEKEMKKKQNPLSTRNSPSYVGYEQKSEK